MTFSFKGRGRDFGEDGSTPSHSKKDMWCPQRHLSPIPTVCHSADRTDTGAFVFCVPWEYQTSFAPWHLLPWSTRAAPSPEMQLSCAGEVGQPVLSLEAWSVRPVPGPFLRNLEGHHSSLHRSCQQSFCLMCPCKEGWEVSRSHCSSPGVVMARCPPSHSLTPLP